MSEYFINGSLQKEPIYSINDKGDIFTPNINKNGRQIGVFKHKASEFDIIDGVLHHTLSINQNFNHLKMVKNNLVIDCKIINFYYKTEERIEFYPLKVEIGHLQSKAQLQLEQEFNKQKLKEIEEQKLKEIEETKKDSFRFVVTKVSPFNCKYCQSGAYYIKDTETGEGIWIDECDENGCKDGASDSYDTTTDTCKSIKYNNEWIKKYNDQFKFKENHLRYQNEW